MTFKMTKTHANNPYDIDFIDDELAPSTYEALVQAMSELKGPDKQAAKRGVVTLLYALLRPDMKKRTVVSARQFAGIYEVILIAMKHAEYPYHLGFAWEDCPDECVPTRAEKELIDRMSDEELYRQLHGPKRGNIYADLAPIWPFVTRGTKYGRATRAIALADRRFEEGTGRPYFEGALQLMDMHGSQYDPKPSR